MGGKKSLVKRRSKLFHDNSELKGKVEEGVFCKELPSTLAWGYRTTVVFFLAEVASFNVAVDLLLRSAASFGEVRTI